MSGGAMSWQRVDNLRLLGIIRRMTGLGARPPSPWKGRADVFEHSYGEVLAFLKHQDEKIGRVLTALAFLTAAGVALFVYTPSSFFAVFMGSLLLSLLAILAAVDPTTQTPRFLRRLDTHNSIIFYKSIYQNRRNWVAVGAPVESLEEQLARSFHADALELSRRAEHKVSRFADARACVHVSVVALTLLGVSRIEGFDPHWRWWIIVGLLIAVAFTPIWDIAMAWHYGFAELGAAGGGSERAQSILLLAVFFLPAVMAMGLLISGGFAPGHDPRLVSVSYALGSLFLSRLSLRYLKAGGMSAVSSYIAIFGLVLLAIVWAR
jgi:hypothetical protein